VASVDDGVFTDCQSEFGELAREVARVRRLMASSQKLQRGFVQSGAVRSGVLRSGKNRERSRPRLRDLFQQELEIVGSLSRGETCRDTLSDEAHGWKSVEERARNVEALQRVTQALAVLGAGAGAGSDEIRRCYREALRKHHPDFAEGEHSRSQFAEVLAAWKVLKEENPQL
jgi:DnaJ-domain-containing protein 1